MWSKLVSYEFICIVLFYFVAHIYFFHWFYSLVIIYLYWKSASFLRLLLSSCLPFLTFHVSYLFSSFLTYDILIIFSFFYFTFSLSLFPFLSFFLSLLHSFSLHFSFTLFLSYSISIITILDKECECVT